jgi:diacylglycerol kinase (ATP)
MRAHNRKMRSPKSTEKCNTFWDSTLVAAGGLIDAVRREKKVRTVVIVLAAVTVVCKFADVGYFQIMMIVFAWVLALICEMFNTSLEKALDYASGKDFHPLIRQGKDYAAACTFVACTFAGVLTLIILWDTMF